ncbi:ATP-binding cassette domain-containing protein [Dickeya poaceiphila]|uniref:ABC transporter ATP-binding protein n=1 Tax=Dickeya poaceiphila TaxID=568768 RepID=A0A5B8IHN1_9GAMM|nr:ABC transporter ATP-binding protein [Dickeya poaceiphila]QDX31190.1 ABC transporter ATP-binding protein [Dickeya poaceiphila]
MIIKNFWFLSSVFLVALQQVLVGLSTYFIGVAGYNISSDIDKTFNYIVLFYASIAFCYIFGSLSLYTRTKLSNSVWSGYYCWIFDEVIKKPSLSSQDNKKKTLNWIAGESLPTIEEASFYYVEILALYFNVLFTIIALIFVLGVNISSVIIGCVVFSWLLIYYSSKSINKMSSEIQNSKVNAFHAIDKIWDNCFFGLKKHYFEAVSYASGRQSIFFSVLQRYKRLEQILACIPVLITIPPLVYISWQSTIVRPDILGAIVAVLPRTIQLFQSINAASMHTTQLMLIKNKVRNLQRFPSLLVEVDYENNIDDNKVVIRNLNDKNINLSVREFVGNISHYCGLPGRYLVEGPNGAGKSSILKVIKQMTDDSVLLGPENSIGIDDIKGSTGQKHRENINKLLSDDDIFILLLDEWDANLDMSNTMMFDKMLDDISHNKVVIEVRHKHVVR